VGNKIFLISCFGWIAPINKCLTAGIDYVPMRFTRTFSIVYEARFHVTNGLLPQVQVFSSVMTPVILNNEPINLVWIIEIIKPNTQGGKIVGKAAIHLTDALSWIIDKPPPPWRKILNKSSVNSILYHLGYKFGWDGVKLSNDF